MPRDAAHVSYFLLPTKHFFPFHHFPFLFISRVYATTRLDVNADERYLDFLASSRHWEPELFSLSEKHFRPVFSWLQENFGVDFFLILVDVCAEQLPTLHSGSRLMAIDSINVFHPAHISGCTFVTAAHVCNPFPPFPGSNYPLQTNQTVTKLLSSYALVMVQF